MPTLEERPRSDMNKDPRRQGQRRARHTHLRHDCRAAVQGLRVQLCRGQQAARQDGLQHWHTAD